MTRFQETTAVSWLLELAVARAERELTPEETKTLWSLQAELGKLDDGATRQTPALEIVMVVS